jgi:hypothetical protein
MVFSKDELPTASLKAFDVGGNLWDTFKTRISTPDERDVGV